MLYSVSFFSSLTVVKSVNRAYKITCDTADTLKSRIVAMVASAALGAYIADYTGLSAAWISVNRMIYRAVSDTGLFHASDDLLKRFKVL